MFEQWVLNSFQVSTLPPARSLTVLYLPLNPSKSFSSLMGKAVLLPGYRRLRCHSYLWFCCQSRYYW